MLSREIQDAMDEFIPADLMAELMASADNLPAALIRKALKYLPKDVQEELVEEWLRLEIDRTLNTPRPIRDLFDAFPASLDDVMLPFACRLEPGDNALYVKWGEATLTEIEAHRQLLANASKVEDLYYVDRLMKFVRPLMDADPKLTLGEALKH